MNSNEFRALRKILCRAADEELLARFNHAEISYKADGSVLTDADLAMNRRLEQELKARYPQYAILSEEMPRREQQRQLAAAERGIWVVDPLDGTSNYAAGVPYFALSLALMIGNQVELALVYDPARGECFHARRGQGAWLDDRRLTRPAGGIPMHKALALVDLKRLPPALSIRLTSAPPYASQRSFGAVALDLCWLAANRVHLYLHGRHNLWDYIAGLTILREAGGYEKDLEFSVNPADGVAPRSSAAALDEALFREWCSWLAG